MKEKAWKLVREDGLTKKSLKVLWIEFGDDGRFKEQYEEPGVGRSLLMGPFNEFFTWQTTVVKEITKLEDNLVEFKTKNSKYTLTYE